MSARGSHHRLPFMANHRYEIGPVVLALSAYSGSKAAGYHQFPKDRSLKQTA
jgi:hypothetical protein